VKTRLGEGCAEFFLNCLLPKEVASTIDFHIDEIEMEVLHASWTSEFSHSMDPERTSPFEAKTHRGLKGQHAAMHYRRAAFARITARKTPLVMQLA